MFKRSVLDMIAEELMSSKDAEQERGCPIGQGAVPIITDPQVRGPLGWGETSVAWCGLDHTPPGLPRKICSSSVADRPAPLPSPA